MIGFPSGILTDVEVAEDKPAVEERLDATVVEETKLLQLHQLCELKEELLIVRRAEVQEAVGIENVVEAQATLHCQDGVDEIILVVEIHAAEVESTQVQIVQIKTSIVEVIEVIEIIEIVETTVLILAVVVVVVVVFAEAGLLARVVEAVDVHSCAALHDRRCQVDSRHQASGEKKSERPHDDRLLVVEKCKIEKKWGQV